MLAAPAGKEGIVEIAHRDGCARRRDARRCRFRQGRKGPRRRFRYAAEVDTLALLTLQTPPENLDAAIELFGGVLRRPRFDTEEWTVAKVKRSTTSPSAKAIGDLAERYGRKPHSFRAARAGGDRPLARFGSVPSSARRPVAIFPRLFSPRTVDLLQRRAGAARGSDGGAGAAVRRLDL